MNNNNNGTIYEINKDSVKIYEEPRKKKNPKKVVTTLIVASLIGSTSYVVSQDPYVVPRTIDTIYYNSFNSKELLDSINDNQYLDDVTKAKVSIYVSKFISDYKKYMNYDLICSVFKNLRIEYEIDNQKKYNFGDTTKAFYNGFDLLVAPYNTIIMFDDDDSVLAHELFHVISRYSDFELTEGMVELLKSETNNMEPNSYGPMMFHIKMLSEFINKDCMMMDFLGYTKKSTANALYETGAFSSMDEVELFLSAMKRETVDLNNFVYGRERSDLNAIESSEQVIMDGYNKLFSKLNKEKPSYFFLYELLVENYQKDDVVSNLFLYVDNTNVYYDNGKEMNVIIQKVSSNKKIYKKAD